MSPPRLPMLDLFSGIGGFSYAMHSLFRTIAYCDIDKTCHDVLNRNMHLRRIDRAPIFEDIKNLKGRNLPEQPVLVTGGFPCQDISGANLYAGGIAGERSGLVLEIVRLIDECPSIKYVLLENSPNTMSRGGEEVVQSLVDRGFYVAWLNVSASSIGAPHIRLRWFCIAFRDLKMPTLTRLLDDDWNRERSVRLVPYLSVTQKMKYRRRCEILGNSVVPQCIQTAWNHVTNIVHRPVRNTKRHKDVVFLLTNRCLFQFPFTKSNKERDYHLRFKHQNEEAGASHWGTPTVSVQQPYRTLTSRGAKMLPTQLYYEMKSLQYVGTFEKDISIDDIDKRWLINPHFIEWLMGYPINWTL